MAEMFTEKQGQFLAYIYNYTVINDWPPAESDLQRFFRTTPPTIHQMILKLEEKGLISRVPGKARSIRVLVDANEIPRLIRPGYGQE
jgi:repressor LexA